jgi:hypothetical protein
MPAVSSQQRRWAFAVKGEAWARKHHMANKGKLPRKVKPGSNPKANAARALRAALKARGGK